MSDPIDNILAARQKTHGLWRQTAGCCHAIKEAMNIWRVANLSATQKETLDQLAIKMARICCGNPNEIDHWNDLAGYARNEADECRRQTGKYTIDKFTVVADTSGPFDLTGGYTIAEVYQTPQRLSQQRL